MNFGISYRKDKGELDIEKHGVNDREVVIWLPEEIEAADLVARALLKEPRVRQSQEVRRYVNEDVWAEVPKPVVYRGSGNPDMRGED